MGSKLSLDNYFLNKKISSWAKKLGLSIENNSNSFRKTNGLDYTINDIYKNILIINIFI